MKRGIWPSAFIGLVLVFFYAPIVVLVANSFNASRFGGEWEGFTLDWYRQLWQSDDLLESLGISLKIAVLASLTSMILGTLAALALHRFRTRLQRLHLGFITVPLVMPDILMGISLLMFFVAVGVSTGFMTIWIAHVTFCLSYVVMVMLARLQGFDASLLDAARDLGAGRWETTRRVLIPLLAPGIIAGGLLAFTLSIDDFVITFFVQGADTTTLPLRIYSMMKSSQKLPVINALSALLLLVTFCVIAVSLRLTTRSRKNMKLITTLAILVLGSAAMAADTLHIYTWADYLNPALVKRFEKEHSCKVKIDTFDSNESMYARLKAGASGYDLIFPSSYIIPLMVSQGMLQPLDHAKIPNIKNVNSEVLAKIPDRKMKHSVPYTFGYAVIGYRKDKLKSVDPTWQTFARTDLKKRVTLLDDMRETIGAALKSLGYSLNTHDEKQLAEAKDVVIGWKKHIAKFDNEGYKAGIDSGEFYVVHGYSGDLWQVMQNNKKVAVVIPKEGVSASCDEMVIPKSAPNPALALAMINTILDGKESAENMESIGYMCPNTEGLKKVNKTFLKNPAVTIPDDVKAKCEVIQDLGDDLKKYTKVWDEIKAAQ